jgi:hypothetical protein
LDNGNPFPTRQNECRLCSRIVARKDIFHQDARNTVPDLSVKGRETRLVRSLSARGIDASQREEAEKGHLATLPLRSLDDLNEEEHVMLASTCDLLAYRAFDGEEIRDANRLGDCHLPQAHGSFK